MMEDEITQSTTDFNITMVKPDGYVHTAAFDEIGETLLFDLQELSLNAKLCINAIDSEARNIVLGANLLQPATFAQLPKDTIIYNFEQLGNKSAWDTPELRWLLSNFQVWDYSTENLQYLETLVMDQSPKLAPIGYCAALSRIEKPVEQDIDVLFYGSLNERRKMVLDSLREAGLNVVHLFGVYGEERDAHIARAKVVLNIHFYDTKIFEIARVSYLLANKKAVVSEFGSSSLIAPALREALTLVPYEDLVTSCIALVNDDKMRAEVEDAGFTAFSALKESDILVDLVLDGKAPASTAPAPVTPKSEKSKATTANPKKAKPPKAQSSKPAPAAAPTAAPSLALPRTLNMGSGKDFRKDCVNLDYSDYWSPDIVTDLSRKDLIGTEFDCDRFGKVTLEEGMFDKIICNDVIEHIPDLVSAMTNCMNMMSVGGHFEILVPYDLSFGAWQDPTHIRAFNENSWLYYTDWHWYLGWKEHRFDTKKLTYNLNPIGRKLHEDGMGQDELIRTPRAVDSMFVVFEKRALTDKEKAVADHFTSRK
ncbi:methyltransferase domain-containing protein [Pseudophaeobacter sp.]|uniref:methyltransferase domain-containing protein n=1 Tax=Pseudophaeobacter sp. TaxID=1971739 RepID=UPI0032992C33